MLESLLNSPRLEVGLIFALFIIWKLVEELFRFKGVKNYKKGIGNDFHEMKCGWKPSDRERISEIRDYVRDVAKGQEKGISDLKEAIKEIKKPQ